MALNPAERRVIQCFGRALFPRDRTLDIDSDDAGVVEYVADFIDRLPTFERGQMRALIQSFDRSYGLLKAKPTLRFVEATVTEQREFIESWDRKAPYLLKMALEGLRTILTIAYTESPLVRQAIGLDYGNAGLPDLQESA